MLVDVLISLIMGMHVNVFILVRVVSMMVIMDAGIPLMLVRMLISFIMGMRMNVFVPVRAVRVMVGMSIDFPITTVEMSIVVMVGMQMNMFMLVRTVSMMVSMQKVFDNSSVFIDHSTYVKLIVEQFVGNQRQRKFEVVFLQQLAVIKNFRGRSIGNDSAVGQNQTPRTYVQSKIEVVSAKKDRFVRSL